MANQKLQSSGRGPRIMPGERIIAAIIFGIFLLIAAGNIGKSITELNKTLTDKNFTDSNTYSSPSDITYEEKTYYTDVEAADYLGITAERVKALIAAGEIPEYIKTDAGYVISKTILDEWFENASYQARITSGGGDSETEE
jgi:excisionase family DNA binding protein